MVCIVETQKPTEGTGFKNLITLGDNQMATVTYRGVKYDTDSRKETKVKPQKELTFRGLKYTKEA